MRGVPLSSRSLLLSYRNAPSVVIQSCAMPRLRRVYSEQRSRDETINNEPRKFSIQVQMPCKALTLFRKKRLEDEFPITWFDPHPNSYDVVRDAHKTPLCHHLEKAIRKEKGHTGLSKLRRSRAPQGSGGRGTENVRCGSHKAHSNADCQIWRGESIGMTTWSCKSPGSLIDMTVILLPGHWPRRYAWTL